VNVTAGLALETPLELIRVPQTELHAPTADVNVTAGLALETPLELIRVPQTELHAPTADVNVTAGLALETPHAAHLPLAVCLEDFSKPLSLSFRLLGNIMADELTIAVLSSLVAFNGAITALTIACACYMLL
jgi:F-type H+-transporting ATPase subunit a